MQPTPETNKSTKPIRLVATVVVFATLGLALLMSM